MAGRARGGAPGRRVGRLDSSDSRRGRGSLPEVQIRSSGSARAPTVSKGYRRHYNLSQRTKLGHHLGYRLWRFPTRPGRVVTVLGTQWVVTRLHVMDSYPKYVPDTVGVSVHTYCSHPGPSSAPLWRAIAPFRRTSYYSHPAVRLCGEVAPPRRTSRSPRAPA